MRIVYSIIAIVLTIGISMAAEIQEGVILKANVAKVIITPPLGTLMVEPQSARATGVHDDLFLRLIVIDDGLNTVVMASYDLVGFDLTLSDQIRKAIADETGIPVSNIMLNCTHAHNTPMTVSLGGDQRKRNFAWESQLKRISVQTVKKSYHNLKNASLSVGTQEVQIAFNRRLPMFSRTRMRPNPFGPVLKETLAIRLDLENDSSAVLFTYPAHPVAVHAESAEFTADFPGFAIHAIEDEMGENVVPVFFQGCAGDVNVDPLKGGYKAAVKVGNTLGNAVVKAVNQGRKVMANKLLASSNNLHLPYRQVRPEVARKIVKRVEEGLAALKASDADSLELMDQADLLNWAKMLLTISENPGKHPGLPFEMQVFAFGKDLAVIAFTHELFVEYQMYIQENSPFNHTMVLAYTNGNASYIPTAEALYLNGYEVHGAQHRYGSPYLTPECDELIRNASIRVLNEIYSNY